jgi:hypothetical protein
VGPRADFRFVSEEVFEIWDLVMMAPFFEGRATNIQDESQSDGRAAIQAMRVADTPRRPKVNAQGPSRPIVGQAIRLFFDSTE